MTKTIKNKKNIKNKTRKNSITFSKKREFIKEILKEWKKQTNGNFQRDKITQYKDDFYLSFNRNGDFFNHIHLILKNFRNDKNIHNNFLYVLKKMDKDNKIVHSSRFKINVLSNPKKVVHNMIDHYKEFINL